MNKPHDPASDHLEQRDADEPHVNPRIVPAQEIFHGEREICIEHEGEIYRLRITRRNKLILQK